MQCTLVCMFADKQVAIVPGSFSTPERAWAEKEKKVQRMKAQGKEIPTSWWVIQNRRRNSHVR